jgi:hypothetical protein
MYYITRSVAIGLILWAGYMAYEASTTVVTSAVQQHQAATEAALKEALGND